MSPAQRTGGGHIEKSWGAWYFIAREEMAFRYGLRRVPKDRYKAQWALGATPYQAARDIHKLMVTAGSVPGEPAR